MTDEQAPENKARDLLADLSPQEKEAVARVHQNREGQRRQMQDQAQVESARAGLQQARTLEPVAKRELGNLKHIPYEQQRVVKTGVDKAMKAADRAYGELVKTAADDTMPREARERIMGEKLEQTRKEVKERVDEIRGVKEVLEATLTMEAIGTPARDREPLARQDAQVVLDHADTVAEGLQKLAADPDPDVRALAAGSWGQRRLEASGSPHAKEQLASIRSTAAQTAKEHGSTRARQAAQALDDLVAMEKLAVLAQGYPEMLLSGWDRSTDGQ